LVAPVFAAALSYAWSFNGTELSDGPDISGTHESTLTLRNVQRSQAGSYTVRVSIGELGITPAPSTVIVEAAPAP
jgi:hypothetical protein